MDKKFIYSNFVMLAEQNNTIIEQAESLLSQSKNINKILKSFFQGCTDSEKNTIKMPLISDKGDQMKFKGKTIFKNKKCNTWYTRYRKDGKQYYISGPSQASVLKQLKEELNYIPKEKIKGYTLDTWYNKWLELFKIGKVKEATIDVYKSLLKHIGNELLNKNIKTITKIDIITRINKIPGNRTKQKVYELLKDIFKKAEDYNICKNIINGIEKPKHKRKSGIAFTHDDEKKFIEYCEEHKDYIYLVTLYQGMRKGEVMALTNLDINFNNKTINIDKAINDKNEIDTTKEEVSIRITPMFDKTYKVLKKINITEGKLFNIKYSTVYNRFKSIISELGLNEKYTMHSLRHTFITHCKNEGIPEHIIQNWVGHEIGSTVTSKVYTHIQEEVNLLNINKLNNSKY